MTIDRDPVEPTPSDLGVPTARTAEQRAAADANDIDRAVDRDVQRDIQRDADRATPPNVQAADAADRVALFEPTVLGDFNNRWTDVQAGFVDEPRRAVQQADALVSDVIQRITNTFTNERAQLEAQWDRGGDVSTEELRQALQRYRSFFSRLLTL
jgi:hypothetical protein